MLCIPNVTGSCLQSLIALKEMAQIHRWLRLRIVIRMGETSIPLMDTLTAVTSLLVLTDLLAIPGSDPTPSTYQSLRITGRLHLTQILGGVLMVLPRRSMIGSSSSR